MKSWIGLLRDIGIVNIPDCDGAILVIAERLNRYHYRFTAAILESPVVFVEYVDGGWITSIEPAEKLDQEAVIGLLDVIDFVREFIDEPITI